MLLNIFKYFGYHNVFRETRNILNATHIINELPNTLTIRFTNEVASNIYVSKSLMKHFLDMTNEDIMNHFNGDDSLLQAVVLLNTF